jgi:hypothetical protein
MSLATDSEKLQDSLYSTTGYNQKELSVNTDLALKLPPALNLGVLRDMRVSDMWQEAENAI